MKSKQSSIRPLGQRSISSTFLFRSSYSSDACKKDEQIKPPTEKGSSVSLTDFLNKKLNKNSVFPGSLQGKTKQFSSPLSGGGGGGGGGVNEYTKENVDEKKKVEEKNYSTFALDVMLEQFKPSKEENKSLASESRKRNHDDINVEAPRKLVAVLGDNSGTRKIVRKRSSGIETKQRPPLYNHYANGGGWWDDSMEGVDNEEVGCNEIWEGVGSTTLGGLGL